MLFEVFPPVITCPSYIECLGCKECNDVVMTAMVEVMRRNLTDLEQTRPGAVVFEPSRTNSGPVVRCWAHQEVHVPPLRCFCEHVNLPADHTKLSLGLNSVDPFVRD